MKTKFWKIVLL
uniref:Uv excision repair protein rad23 n=1 Tax=Rhizophora mucronata TaxID=61149 RepID=A0A2P2ME34_RHIMU